MCRNRNILKCMRITVFLLLALVLSSASYGMGGKRENDLAKNQRDSTDPEYEFFYFWVDRLNEEGEFVTLLVEGVFQEDEEGNLTVPWMWTFSENGVDIIQLFDSGPQSKHFTCEAFQTGQSHRTIDINAVGFLRGEHLPIPECVVVFSALEPEPATRVNDWRWNGDFVGNETDGSNTNGSGDCEEPISSPGDERYVIRISDTEVLVVIISNGRVTVLIYRKGIDGCWRFDSAPADDNGVDLPGYTVGQTLPIVLSEYLLQVVNGQLDEVPPFPYP